MRIAVSGTHASGKTTLIAELAACLPGFDVIDEPYHALEAEGHVFSHQTFIGDFELQLRRSLESTNVEGNVLLDRCPVDFLAYLACLYRKDPTSLGPWLPEVERALQTIDVVVFAPLESPDRIDPGDDEFPRLRRCVDGKLRQFLLEDSLGLSANVIEVSGSVNDRVTRILAYVRESRIVEPPH